MASNCGDGSSNITTNSRNHIVTTTILTVLRLLTLVTSGITRRGSTAVAFNTFCAGERNVNVFVETKSFEIFTPHNVETKQAPNSRKHGKENRIHVQTKKPNSFLQPKRTACGSDFSYLT